MKVFYYLVIICLSLSKNVLATDADPGGGGGGSGGCSLRSLARGAAAADDGGEGGGSAVGPYARVETEVQSVIRRRMDFLEGLKAALGKEDSPERRAYLAHSRGARGARVVPIADDVQIQNFQELVAGDILTYKFLADFGRFRSPRDFNLVHGVLTSFSTEEANNDAAAPDGGKFLQEQGWHERPYFDTLKDMLESHCDRHAVGYVQVHLTKGLFGGLSFRLKPAEKIAVPTRDLMAMTRSPHFGHCPDRLQESARQLAERCQGVISRRVSICQATSGRFRFLGGGDKSVSIHQKVPVMVALLLELWRIDEEWAGLAAEAECLGPSIRQALATAEADAARVAEGSERRKRDKRTPQQKKADARNQRKQARERERQAREKAAGVATQDTPGGGDEASSGSDSEKEEGAAVSATPAALKAARDSSIPPVAPAPRVRRGGGGGGSSSAAAGRTPYGADSACGPLGTEEGWTPVLGKAGHSSPSRQATTPPRGGPDGSRRGSPFATAAPPAACASFSGVPGEATPPRVSPSTSRSVSPTLAAAGTSSTPRTSLSSSGLRGAASYAAVAGGAASSASAAAAATDGEEGSSASGAGAGPVRREVSPFPMEGWESLSRAAEGPTPLDSGLQEARDRIWDVAARVGLGAGRAGGADIDALADDTALAAVLGDFP